MPPLKLVAGLGNPGSRYEGTRHNLGFAVIDCIARRFGVKFKTVRCNALAGELELSGKRVFLVKPQEYMNRSGEAVAELLGECSTGPEDLIVVYDDLDLPFGRLRIRAGGGAGGHLGLQSILESLGGAPFYRVRLGIGRPPEGSNPTDFVLERFSAEEAGQLGDFVARAGEAVVFLLEHGGERAMQQFNRVR